MLKGMMETGNIGLYEVKEEFKTAVEIAEVAFDEGKHMKAAYWIGQATVYAELHQNATPGYDYTPLQDVAPKHYEKWVWLRWIYQS